MIKLATECMLNKKLKKTGYGTGLYPPVPYTAVKVPIFSFEKLADLDTHLGPEMKSTGEVLGLGKTLDEALYKGLVAAGYKMKPGGGVLLTVRDSDKYEIAGLAKKYYDLGYKIYATDGTAAVIKKSGIPCTPVDKIFFNAEENTMTLLDSGKINLLVSTSTRGRIPTQDDVKLRRRAVLLGVPCLTSIDTANALCDSLKSRYSQYNTELVNLNNMRKSRQKLLFTKMHGAGNDFICVDCFNEPIRNMESVAVNLADRHFGVGADSVVFIMKSDIADAGMRMFNADGSEGLMGGNAVRCVAKFLYDAGRIDKSRREMTVETKSGVKKLQLFVSGGTVNSVKADMGEPQFSPKDIPMKFDGEKAVGARIVLAGAEMTVTALSIGNPHCVIFVDDVNLVDVAGIGKAIEFDPVFPRRVNVEFVQVLDATHLRMRVWERGSGETMACGTGACAGAVAAVLKGDCPLNADISVKLQGGELTVNYSGDTVTLSGEAAEVFKGEVKL
jgi:carbamoyl-phosphate synthase large subunit